MENRRYSIDLDAVPARDKQALTHGIHPYPAKYIPQIPASILTYLDIPAGSTVLDPFCGSGTTLLEAAIRGCSAIGIDSNPIATLISSAKCTLLSEAQTAQVRELLAAAEACVPGGALPGDIPEFLNRDHWFQKNMQQELGYLRHLTDSARDPQVKTFLSAVFSAILVKASNQESDTRWRAKNKNLPDGFALSEFVKKGRDTLARMEQLRSFPLGQVSVRTQDSRNMDFLADNSVDCAITSPPYMNSFDYYLYHKLRMYWLGYDHYPVQEAEIGSRNKHCDGGRGADVYVDSISQVVAQVHRKLVPGGFFCVVIGDSIYKKERIPMDEVYREIAARTGFAVREVFSFDQRKYTRAFTPNLQTGEKKSHIMFLQK